MTSPRETGVTIDGRRLYVRQWGPPDAPAVVLLHGIIGNSHEWETVAAHLAADRQVILPDQRGHGASDWADDYRAEGFVSDLTTLTDELALDTFDLVGHSLGGIVATLYAARPTSRARSLAILDIGPDSLNDPDIAGGVREMLNTLASATYPSVDEAVAAWMEGNPRALPTETRRWAVQCLRQNPDGTCRWAFDAEHLTEFVDDAPTLPLWTTLREISVPTLLVRGAESDLLTRETAHRMTTALPNGRLVEIDNAAHDLGVENPHETASHLTTFLPRATT